MLEAKGALDRIKVIDFGTAHEVTKGKLMRKIYGTKAYIAPEVLQHNYNSKCDIWSIGVMCYILLCGR
jgi:calcium-dependent protein kinase